LVHDFRCLKHEVRQLKSLTRSAIPLLSSDASSHDSDLVHDVCCLKHEVRQLKSLARSPSPLLSSDAGSPDSDLAHDVRCLKHEVRQLKCLRRSPARLFASASALPMERVDCAPSVCGFGRRERTLFAKLEEDVAALMSATSQHDLRCLKHEVCLLKARTSQSETPEDMHPASCGELHRLEEKVDALCAVIGQVTSEDVRHDVKCMKFELKRLLGIRERGMSGSPG
jgi:hypothetical protein